tara:strand:+ start:52 stop:420 length:369 start_codon:yes stop_codon:yes gene_type:complete
MQSSSDRLRKYHNYNNYLYSHHSSEFIINCDISLCTEIIKTSHYNPLARKVILKPDYGSSLTELTRGVDVETMTQSQYLSHNKTCTNNCSDNIVNKPGVGVKHNSYHRYNGSVKSKTIQADV